MMERWKNGRIEKILISPIFVWLGVKKWRDKKVNLYKFTHITLLKNEALLKQTKKSNKKKSPEFIRK